LSAKKVHQCILGRYGLVQRDPHEEVVAAFLCVDKQEPLALEYVGDRRELVLGWYLGVYGHLSPSESNLVVGRGVYRHFSAPGRTVHRG
jgi:hypothetical protein